MQLALVVFFVGILLMIHIFVVCLRLRHVHDLEARVKYWQLRWHNCNTALQNSEAQLLEYTLRIRYLECATKDAGILKGIR